MSLIADIEINSYVFIYYYYSIFFMKKQPFSVTYPKKYEKGKKRIII